MKLTKHTIPNVAGSNLQHKIYILINFILFFI